MTIMLLPPEGRCQERARQDSNLRLLPPEGSALSTELRAPATHHRVSPGTGASGFLVAYPARRAGAAPAQDAVLHGRGGQTLAEDHGTLRCAGDVRADR